MMSEEFQEILRTDPTTENGEAKVVNYFDIADERLKRMGQKKRTYFRFCINLLLSIIDC